MSRRSTKESTGVSSAFLGSLFQLQAHTAYTLGARPWWPYIIWGTLLLHSFVCGYPVAPLPSVENTFFLIEISCHLWQKSIDHRCKVYLWTLNDIPLMCLSSHHRHPVLIAVALQAILKSRGNVSPPTLFFFFISKDFIFLKQIIKFRGKYRYFPDSLPLPHT